MGTGYLKHFGFQVPLDIAGRTLESRGRIDPPRDSRPVTGICVLCKRERGRTYVRGDGARVCSVDIEEIVKSRKVNFRPLRRPRSALPECPEEVVWLKPFAEEDYRAGWWDRQFS